MESPVHFRTQSPKQDFNEYLTMVHIQKGRYDITERLLATPSPLKNLTEQPIIPPIGRTDSFHRTLTSLSIQLEDIRLQKKTATDFFPKPVENLQIEKQKTVHFDKFVRVRYAQSILRCVVLSKWVWHLIIAQKKVVDFVCYISDKVSIVFIIIVQQAAKKSKLKSVHWYLLSDI